MGVVTNVGLALARAIALAPRTAACVVARITVARTGAGAPTATLFPRARGVVTARLAPRDAAPRAALETNMTPRIVRARASIGPRVVDDGVWRRAGGPALRSVDVDVDES